MTNTAEQIRLTVKSTEKLPKNPKKKKLGKEIQKLKKKMIMDDIFYCPILVLEY